MIGTSDQSCWLAKACKIHALEGLWIYGVTVSHASFTVVAVTNGCGSQVWHQNGALLI